MGSTLTHDKFEHVDGGPTDWSNFSFAQSVLLLKAVTLFITSSSFMRENDIARQTTLISRFLL